jgi:hypothetical protein
MSGGSITGNSAASSGGGVYVNGGGAFTMSGGSITGNSSSNGGGVCVDSSGTLIMSGGSITGNSASSNAGGGVYVGYSGSFTMNGGNITGNTASYGGEGVYVDSNGTFIMSNNARIDPSNGVYLDYYSGSSYAGIAVAGDFSGSDTVAVIDLYGGAADWLGKRILLRDTGYTGTIPADRFSLGSFVSGGYSNGNYETIKTPITSYVISSEGRLVNR